MKKIFTSVIILMTAAMMAVAYSKPEEPIVPESKLVGTWVVPFSIAGEEIGNFAGKKLIINEDHTATFSILSFNNWKIEGDQLTLTNMYGEGLNRHLEVLRYTIVSYVDTAMLLTGNYISTVGDSVYVQGDLSGLFTRDKEQQ